MARTNAVVGAFFLAGALAVWWSLLLGAFVGGLLLLAFALFAATGNVDVISKLSKEERPT